MGLPRTFPVRWLLVTAVGAGVVAMHVLVYLGGCGGGSMSGSETMSGLVGPPAAAFGGTHPGVPTAFSGTRSRARTGPAAPHGMDHQPSGMPDGGMLGHFCLAVLDAFGALVLLALLMLTAALGVPGVRFDSPRRRPLSPRAPPDRPSGRTSLTELCVARR